MPRGESPHGVHAPRGARGGKGAGEMTTVNRRRFLRVGGVGAGLGLGAPGMVLGAAQRDAAAEAGDADERRVRLSGDGVGLTAAQYSRLLIRLCDERGI